MSEELKISEEYKNGSLYVILSGEIDIYTSQGLKERLCDIVEREKSDLKIDCSNLNYIDSTGLGILVGVLKKVKQNGNKIYLLNMKENIKKLFVITGLDKVFNIEE